MKACATQKYLCSIFDKLSPGLSMQSSRKPTMTNIEDLISVHALINAQHTLWVVYIVFLNPPQTLFVGGILFSRCPSVRASVRP